MSSLRLRIMQHRPDFAGDSCLPLTMHLARLAEQVIEPILESPTEWPFEDRVLVALSPSLAKDVTAYHDGHGAQLMHVLKPRQIERLDRTLVGGLHQLLSQRLGLVSHG